MFKLYFIHTICRNSDTFRSILMLYEQFFDSRKDTKALKDNVCR